MERGGGNRFLTHQVIPVIMTAIAFTGMPGSGKTEAVKVAQKRKILVVRMGDAVWDEVKTRGLTVTDAHVGHIATEMRKTCGRDIWALRTLPKIEGDIVIIDGVRTYEEIETFRKKLGGVTLVALHAAPSIRYRRMLARGRMDDALNRVQLEERDKRELEWGIGSVIAMADMMFINEGTLKDLRVFVNKVLDAIVP